MLTDERIQNAILGCGLTAAAVFQRISGGREVLGRPHLEELIWCLEPTLDPEEAGRVWNRLRKAEGGVVSRAEFLSHFDPALAQAAAAAGTPVGDDWAEHEEWHSASDGRKYWYSPTLGRSSWTQPLPALPPLAAPLVAPALAAPGDQGLPPLPPLLPSLPPLGVPPAAPLALLPPLAAAPFAVLLASDGVVAVTAACTACRNAACRGTAAAHARFRLGRARGPCLEAEVLLQCLRAALLLDGPTLALNPSRALLLVD